MAAANGVHRQMRVCSKDVHAPRRLGVDAALANQLEPRVPHSCKRGWVGVRPPCQVEHDATKGGDALLRRRRGGRRCLHGARVLAAQRVDCDVFSDESLGRQALRAQDLVEILRADPARVDDDGAADERGDCCQMRFICALCE